MGKAPAFEMYAGDYYMDTNHWTIDEIGIYQRLLLTEWVNGGLPSEEKRLARIAGCSIKKFQKGWATIKVKFIQNGGGHLINPRLEKEREKQAKYLESQSEKGKISAKLSSTVVATVVQPVFQPNGQPNLNQAPFKEREKEEREEKGSHTLLKEEKEEREREISSSLVLSSSLNNTGSNSKEKQPGILGSHLNDQQWLSYIKSLPAFSHVDIDFQLSRMDAWLSARPGRQKTRRFVINWLNKIEKPLKTGQPAFEKAKNVGAPSWIGDAMKEGWK